MKRRGAQITMSDCARFLRALFPIVDPTSRVEVRAIWPDGKMKREFFDDLRLLEWAALKVGEVANVYVGVATRRDHISGKKDNLAWAGAYFAELDAGDGKPYKSVDEIMTSLDAFTPCPSMRVLSGGGVHAYWTLDVPVPLFTPEQIAEYEAVTRGLQWRLRADRGTWDASRVLRIPGTLWHKEQPPRLVRLLQ